VTADQVAAVIAGWRGTAREVAVQAHLAAVLAEAGGVVAREVPIVGGRIDIVCDRVGVEVKIAGALAAVARQVIRYAAEPGLDAIVVATTHAQHRQLPRSVRGKPIIVVHMCGVI
jgi:hypothetical protein